MLLDIVIAKQAAVVTTAERRRPAWQVFMNERERQTWRSVATSSPIPLLGGFDPRTLRPFHKAGTPVTRGGQDLILRPSGTRPSVPAFPIARII
jgi:hypothetical protein